MSQTKAQLISSNVLTGASFVGVVTATEFDISGSPNTFTSSGVNISGVVTATSAIVGSAVTILSSGINVTGVVTATSFVGSGANLTGITAGVTTSKSVGLNFFFGY